MIDAALLHPAEAEAEESGGKRHRNVPFSSLSPMMIGGKATLRDDKAEFLLHWVGGEFNSRVIWTSALNFVRQCYPEAGDIMLRPDGDNRIIADFRVNRNYKRGTYEYKVSRYEVQA